MTIIAQPQIQPLPSVPISDRNGRVSREWWRWFHNTFTNFALLMDAVGALQTSAELFPADPPPLLVQMALTVAGATPPPDPSPPISATMLAALAAGVPQDAVLSPAQIAFLSRFIAPPPDVADPSQPALLSMMLSTPA